MTDPDQRGAKVAPPSDTTDGDEPGEDGYDGPGELLADDQVVAVTVALRGHFDPISGKYRWYGRVAAGPQVAALAASGARKVRLRTPHAEVETALTDVDPWGRPRVEGFGAAPFEVLDSVVGDDD
jgi:uncharacterized protein DUF4873